MDLQEFKTELEKAVTTLNEDTQKRWEDKKFIEVSCFKQEDNAVTFNVAVGKWGLSFYKLKISDGVVSIKNYCNTNATSNKVIDYFICCVVEPMIAIKE